MKTFTFAAALSAAVVLPVAAYAADAGQHQSSGQYEWCEVPQFGGCDCAMMNADRDGSMLGMHSATPSPAS